jgi:hypothetical protein
MTPIDALDKMDRMASGKTHSQWQIEALGAQAAVVQAHALVEIAQRLAAIQKLLERK